MVIAKILPASSIDFSGVPYNDKKQEKNKAMLLEVNNFVGLDINSSSRKDYVMYLQKQSSFNSKIKKPQLHVTISSKGKTKSFEELQEFTKVYMDKMGYGNNPYLVYSHQDTKNNHLHIISTRIDSNGKKINDSFEFLRSQEIVNLYYGLDYKNELETFRSQLDSYKVSNINQYKLLLEKSYKFKETKEDFILYKSDQKLSISKSSILDNISKNKLYFKSNKVVSRKKEIKDILLDLTSKNPIEDLPILANQKDLNLTFFYKKDSPNEVFGFTVIDNKSNTVFKGSEIVSFKELENRYSNTKELDSIKNLIVANFKNRPTSIKEINKFLLDQSSLKIDFYGNVFSYSNQEKQKLPIQLDKDFLKPYYYQSRKDLANSFTVLSHTDKSILSHLFNVSKNDIDFTQMNKVDYDKSVSERKKLNSYYNSIISFYCDNKIDKMDFEDKLNINIYRSGNTFFIADSEKKSIISFEPTDLNLELLNSNNLYTTIYREQHIENSKRVNIELLKEFGSLYDDMPDDQKQEQGKGKKKKRNKSRGI